MIAHLSLGEIAATVVRAGIGRGWSAGLAEDLADAARAWGLQGRDPLAMALAALKVPPADGLDISGSGAAWRIAQAPVLGAGPTALDLAEAGPAPVRVQLAAVDAPACLLALTLARALRQGGLWEVWSGAQAASHIGAGAVRLGEVPEPGAPMVLERRGDAPPLRPSRPPAGIAADPALWKALRALAAKTLVPATDASRRAGAGAGLTDSD